MIDFAIIGGGIAGLSAAAKISPLGKTILFEGETTTGYHASGRSAAMYLKDYGNAQIRALNYASHQELETAQVLKQRDMLIPARADQRAQFEVDFTGFQMSEISTSDALKLCPILAPDALAFAAYRDDAYDVDADLLMQSYIKSARANGAQIRTKSHVDQITKTPHGWQIKTCDHDVTARILVNAAGAWVDDIAARAGIAPLGFQPYRRSVARMPAPGGHDVKNWPFMLGVGEAWFAKPDAGRWLVSPAEKHPVAPFDAYADDMVLAEGIARYQELISEQVTRVDSSWAGLRTFAPDETLVVGRDVNDPSFIWLGGQGGYGFQTAPAASDLLADVLADRTPAVDPAIYAPARFS